MQIIYDHQYISLIILLTISVLLFAIIIKIYFRPRRVYLDKPTKQYISNIKLMPSKDSYIFKQGVETYMRKIVANNILKRKVVFEGKDTEDKTHIGRYGEKAFAKTNKWAKAEVPFSSKNWKGYIDFIDKYRLYEIKTTEYRGYIRDSYQEKWRLQIAIYLYFTKKPSAKLIVYLHKGNGVVTEKYFKTYRRQDILQEISFIDSAISKWKGMTIGKGYTYIKPQSFKEVKTIKNINRRA